MSSAGAQRAQPDTHPRTVLVVLVETMSAAADDILQNLVETARDLCRAHWAGISMLEGDRERLRWAAVRGK